MLTPEAAGGHEDHTGSPYPSRSTVDKSEPQTAKFPRATGWRCIRWGLSRDVTTPKWSGLDRLPQPSLKCPVTRPKSHMSGKTFSEGREKRRGRGKKKGEHLQHSLQGTRFGMRWASSRKGSRWFKELLTAQVRSWSCGVPAQLRIFFPPPLHVVASHDLGRFRISGGRSRADH